MVFSKSWVETDPDGSAITISQLDNSDRDIKIALRERLEGDGANLLTGVFETASWAAAPITKKGSGRFYIDTEANLNAAGNPNLDGRGLFTNNAGTSHPKVYSKETAAAREIAYLNRDGTRPLLGTFSVAFTITTSVDGIGVQVDLATAVAAITLPNMYGFWMKSPNIGAGSAINTLYGIKIEPLTVGTAANYAIHTSAGRIRLGWTGSDTTLDIDQLGNVVLGSTAMVVGATSGHVFIQKVAGAPTGVPAAITGHVALMYDSTNNQIYVNNAGTWKKTVALT